ncbi:WXG100-like domain-containing protein [Micromonospora taraxaci]
MGLQLPGELATFLSMIGYDWPQADETALVEMGQRWLTFSGTLQTLTAEAGLAAQPVSAGNTGADIDAFQRYWTEQDGPAQVLQDGALAATLAGTGLMIVGAIVLALKIQVIVQLVILGVQIAQAVATAAATFGATLAEIPIFQMITREIVGLLIDEVIGALLDG